jgi:hypothetical protein
MPIPSFNTSGVLPPFVGDNPTDAAAMAPYSVVFSDFFARFGTSPERWRLLKGLHAYRSALRTAGLISGFQWIDGSFLEDVERIRERPPADIDLVTFADLPTGASSAAFAAQRRDLFHPGETKQRYSCDAYFVDLTFFRQQPAKLVERTRYWFGLFSHQRTSHLWKGMLELPLVSDDDAVTAALAAEEPTRAA